MQYIAHYNSPIGPLTLTGSEQALTGLWLDGQKHLPGTSEGQYEEKNVPSLEQARKWLDIYFSGREPAFLPSLALHGSPFRRRVWALLTAIPFGQTVTYGELARQLARETGKGASAQAVGGAVGHNPVAIIVPCHRVIGAGGNLTGYAGGIEKKLRLLQLEGVAPADLHLPRKLHLKDQAPLSCGA